MVDGISSQTQGLQMLQGKKPPSAEDMFAKLSNDVGGDGKTVTKDQVDSLISKLESDGSSEDKGKLGFLKQLSSNFDKISNGNDSITATDLKNGMESLKPPTGDPGGAKPDGSGMFDELSKKVGADSNGITKDNLETYLKKLQENGSDSSKESELISNLIKDFDKVSGGTDTITASSLQQAFKSNSNGSDFQDPRTITSDQLQPPIDLRV